MRVATKQEREDYFAKRAKGRPAVEQNGLLEGGRYRLATKQDIVDFLNDLASKHGYAQSPNNPNGYKATLENVGKP